MSFSRRRLTSGVPGFDEVLGGGMLIGGVYLLAGGPGTGKTVVANQICFAHARRGLPCVYVTVLAESHSRMVMNMESFGFFDAAAPGQGIAYLSGARVLREGGLDALYELIENEVRRRAAVVLVLDGLCLGAEMTGESEYELTRFLNRLASLLEYCDCTAVLCILCEVGMTAPAYALADGLLELTHRPLARRAARELFVRKLRGSLALEGCHAFDITQSGVVLYPRVESLVALDRREQPASKALCGFGIHGLDALTGGLPEGSSTAIVGSPGVGKTLLGLHLLAEGAARGEPALYCGCLESPERLLDAGEGIGLGLRRLEADGKLTVAWQRPFGNAADAQANDILQRVRHGRIRRLYVDGFDVLVRNSLFNESLPELLAPLTYELGLLGVTTLISFETMPASVDSLRTEETSAFVDNMIVLRYAEDGARLRRLVSVRKVRGGAADPTRHELVISSAGVLVRPCQGDPAAPKHSSSRDTPT